MPRSSSDLTPLVFVAMPFGKRRGSRLFSTIDFDNIYESAIAPAIEEFGLRSIRGDEEARGGLIMRDVYERLLLAEIVIADLTLQNPNVFYEVGVRHCAKPRSTILISADTESIPFDLAGVRAVPYSLTGDNLTEDSRKKLKTDIKRRLQHAIESRETMVDSPLKQLLPDVQLAQLPPTASGAFMEKTEETAKFVGYIKDAKAEATKETAVEILNNIESELKAPNETNVSLYTEMMFAHRANKCWEEMIRLSTAVIDSGLSLPVTLAQQRALALNRRNQGQDRIVAEREMLSLIDRNGDDPETCGIIGRIFKDRYQEAAGYNDSKDNHDVVLKNLHNGSPKAMEYLGMSIHWYERGFASDPRDYYPGVNEVTLRFVRWGWDDPQRLKILLPTVLFAVGRDSGDDYWLIATELELQSLIGDWKLADRTFERLIACRPSPMEIETTANNLRLIREARRLRKEDFSKDDELLRRFRAVPYN